MNELICTVLKILMPWAKGSLLSVVLDAAVRYVGSSAGCTFVFLDRNQYLPARSNGRMICMRFVI